jgi:hypothetical protein
VLRLKSPAIPPVERRYQACCASYLWDGGSFSEVESEAFLRRSLSSMRFECESNAVSSLHLFQLLFYHHRLQPIYLPLETSPILDEGDMHKGMLVAIVSVQELANTGFRRQRV